MRERDEPDVKRVDPRRGGGEREGRPSEHPGEQPGGKPDMPPRKPNERETSEP